MANYPSEIELKTIEEWDLTKQPIKGLLDIVQNRWEYDDYFILSGKKVLKLQLHTGGWSGNEDLVNALMGNFLFWSMFWQKSVRGGHYYFKIPLKLCKK